MRKEFLTVTEYAKEYKVSRQYIHKLIKQGKLCTKKVRSFQTDKYFYLLENKPYNGAEK